MHAVPGNAVVNEKSVEQQLINFRGLAKPILYNKLCPRFLGMVYRLFLQNLKFG